MTDPATARLQVERDRFREELMRCGLLAVSERIDGCIPKAAALRIREIAHRTCWPDDDRSSVVERVSAYTETPQ